MAGHDTAGWPSAHRFRVAPEAIEGDRVRITGAQARQIDRVLRLRPRDPVRVFDGGPTEYLLALDTVDPDAVTGTVIARCQPRTEPRCRLWLAVPLLKAEKLGWVVQKSVELGASGILLTTTRRTVVRLERDRGAARIERYRRIALEATEQCGRLTVPAVEGPVSWSEALERATAVDLALAAHERASTSLRAAVSGHVGARSAAVYLGPEGGLTPEEIEQAERAGVRVVSLGRRVLRAETAALAAAAILLSLIEDAL